MPILKKKRLFLIKIAAIGDIAIACHAFKLLNLQFNLDNIELYWVVDESLIPLAKTLLFEKKIFEPHQIHWIPISSQTLFSNSLLKKIFIAIKMWISHFFAFPQTTVVLHRDTRYRSILKLNFINFKKIFFISKHKEHSLKSELHVYLDLLTQAAKNLGLPLQPLRNLNVINRKRSSPPHVALFIGGGKNSKTTFLEKRWPFFPQLAELFLKKTNFQISLLGSKEDQETEGLYFSNYFSIYPNRISDFIGKITLEQIPSILESVDALITPDSGIAHIANCCMQDSTQTILSLFGPTDPSYWGPQNIPGHTSPQNHVFYKKLHCSPCYKQDGHFNPCLYQGELFQKCMKSITVEEVFEKTIQILSS